MVRLRRSTPGVGGLEPRSPAARARAAELAIPPAWTDLWICADPLGHIQATGTDSAGRVQYLYHPAWREKRDREKSDRVLELARTLPAARRQTTLDLRQPGFGRRRVLAAAFRILDRARLRVGGEEYEQANGTRGLATLLCRHVRVAGPEVTFHFPAKSGKRWDSTVTDPDLATFAAEMLEARGLRSRFLAWKPENDQRAWRTVTAADINADVRNRTGGDFSAKDFRTLAGTLAAAEALAAAGPPASPRAATRDIAAAMRDVAALLGNTPAVARASYVDPRVLDRYRAGHDPLAF